MDFENYEGYYLGNSSENILKVIRMVPRKEINYFFTVN